MIVAKQEPSSNTHNQLSCCHFWFFKMCVYIAEDGKLNIVMEYCAGGNLLNRIRKGEPVTDDQVIL